MLNILQFLPRQKQRLPHCILQRELIMLEWAADMVLRILQALKKTHILLQFFETDGDKDLNRINIYNHDFFILATIC